MHDCPPHSPCPPLDRHPRSPRVPARAVHPHESAPGPLHRWRALHGQGHARLRHAATPGRGTRPSGAPAVPAPRHTAL